MNRRRILRWGLLAASVLLLLAYAGASYVVASGVTSDERGPLDDHPDNHGLEYIDVEFQSRVDRIPLKGWWIPGRESGATVIMVHGITSNRASDNALGVAARLRKLGYNLLLFDQRAHGESGGERISGGYHERRDLGGAIDFLKSRGVPESSMGVLGMSMGAGTTLLTLPGEPGIRAAVLDSPYASADDLIAFEVARTTFFPEWVAPVFIPGAKVFARALYGINVDALTPEQSAAELDYPVLIIHGTADTRVPYQHGLRVHAAAPEGSVLWSLEGVDHVDAFAEEPDEYIRRVHSYFSQRLR